MRPGSLLPLLALGNAVQAAASTSSQSAALLARDIEQLTSRDLEQMSPLEVRELAMSLDERGVLEDIWNKFKDATTCAGGEALLAALKVLAAFGDKGFVKVIQGLCKLAKVQPDDVCDGAVALEGPIIASDIRKMKLGSRTAKAFLTTIIGVCEYPDVQPWNIPFPSPKPAGGRPKPSGKDPIKVVHYSDIHIDPQYVAGSSTECDGRPICCRPYTEDDEPGKTDTPAGPNGDHMCDTPFSLESSMYKAINELVPDVAFTIFTGDIVDHTIWNTSKPYNSAIIEHAYNSMNESLNLVYGTAGNHESHPANSFAPESVNDDVQWLYDQLSSEWSHWIGDVATNAVEEGGAYSTKYPNGKLRVISLNTNFYYKLNFWMFQAYDEKDPNGQIQWLVKELDAAEKAGDHVYIIGHMPPGNTDSLPDGSHYLDQVFNRYSSTIAAMFYGHTHVDHFALSYSDWSAQTYSNAYLTSYIAPSLTPMSGMPSFRVYDVDPATFAVLDHTTYFADMANPAFQTTGPVWTKLYSAKEAYGPSVNPPLTDPKAELSAAFWHNVTEAFEKNDDLFNQYMSRKSRGWKPASCTGDCKTDEICQLRANRAENNCFKPTPGIHFSKRSGVDHDHGEHDECGVPISLKTLSALSFDKKAVDGLKKSAKEAINEAKKEGVQPEAPLS